MQIDSHRKCVFCSNLQPLTSTVLTQKGIDRLLDQNRTFLYYTVKN